MQLHINLPGYEEIKVELNDQGELEAWQLQCSPLTLALFEDQLKTRGRKVSDWTLAPVRSEHLSPEHHRSQMLLGELILRAQAKWNLPYENEMVCQCRQISSEVIDRSIAAGAKTVEAVALWTTACTSCTACKGKIEELIVHRLSPISEKEVAVEPVEPLRKISG